MLEPRPLIAVTMGDPAGVGPEIAVRALADPGVHRALHGVLVGDAAILREVVAGCGLDVRVRIVAGPEEATGESGVVEVIDHGLVAPPTRFGAIDADYGRAAVAYIETAVELARAGRVDAVVTGPINKESNRAGGSPHPGHTEMLAELCGVPVRDALTMFVVDRLRIFFLTRHQSLRDAIALLDQELVVGGIKRMDHAMRELGFAAPRLTVAALNPHAGEGGLMGDEEDTILRPAVAAARALGIDVAGPVPADSVFYQAREGRSDAVLSLFHDQGHIAAKTLDFFGTVSCTLGLGIVRCAAEHGTAFDIAGRWIADPRGQVAALHVATELATSARLTSRESAPRRGSAAASGS